MSRSLIRIVGLTVSRVLLLCGVSPVVGLLITGRLGLLRIPRCRMLIRPRMTRLLLRLLRRIPRLVGHVVGSLFLFTRCTLFLRCTKVLLKACPALLRID